MASVMVMVARSGAPIPFTNTDPFTRPDGAVGNGWSNAGTPGLTIASNQLVGTGSGRIWRNHAYNNNVFTFTADVTRVAAGNGFYFYWASVNSASGTQNGYRFYLDTGGAFGNTPQLHAENGTGDAGMTLLKNGTNLPAWSGTRTVTIVYNKSTGRILITSAANTIIDFTHGSPKSGTVLGFRSADPPTQTKYDNFSWTDAA